MNIIDKVILEWCYRTKKGYPDINSQEDMALFESMFGFNLNEAKLKALLKHLAIAIVDNNLYKKIEIENLKILGLSDSVWLDSICELHKLERNKITFGLNEFCLHLKAQGETEKTLKDLLYKRDKWNLYKNYNLEFVRKNNFEMYLCLS